MTTPLHIGSEKSTLIGRVRHVLGARITAELDEEVAGTTPIYRGRVYHIGQVGSLVRVPQGTNDLIGAVTMLGIAELVSPTEPAIIPQQGDRWIQFQLLGELDALGRFHRGVGTYPSVDDPVHFATHTQLAAIYPKPAPGRIRVGTLSTSRGDVVNLELGRMVMRHSAVVGSTGSGKSSTVARILQAICGSGMNRANVVVIDPHGEYSAALKGQATVRSVMEKGDDGLFVPYWALGMDDLLHVFGRGAEKNITIRNRFQDLVLHERQEFLKKAKWDIPRPEDITVDTPVPFDIRAVWHQLDFDNNATYPQQAGQGDPCVETKGIPETLTPTKFKPYALGSVAPFKGKTHGHYSPLPDRLRVKLTDPRFSFLAREWPDPSQEDPLPRCISKWLGETKPVSILDFGGVPGEAADVAIGAILTLLFEAAAASPPDKGIGRSRPIWVVLEEAHRFLGKSAPMSANLAREAAERIAREGRKHGIGIMIVSQRPSELSDTVLSQCGSIIAMRLTNPTDQGSVKAALPDDVASMAESLPALRTGEALVTGEAIVLPSRVLIDRPSPEPHASDPPITSWNGAAAENDVKTAVHFWRGGARAKVEPEKGK